MRRQSVLLCLALALTAAPWVARAQTVLECGRLLDVNKRQAVENVSILVAGNRIEAVGTNVEVPANAGVIDLTDLTCAPGFMDMHVHLAHDGGVTANPYTFSRSASWRAMRSLAAAQAMLDRGFTTIRTLGFDRHFETIDLRNAVDSGEHRGPRIFVAPHGVMGVGQATLLGRHAYDPEGTSADSTQFILRGTGPVEMRRITAREISYGADWIKLIDAFGASTTLDDLRAVVEEAHRHGKKVTQHVTMDPEHEAAKLAVAAGVDSIDHAFITDKDVLRDMAKRGIYYVPTIWIIDYLARQEPGFEITENMHLDAGMQAAMAPMAKLLKQNTRLAHELGVPIVLGSDTVFRPDVIADAVGEFSLLAEATGDPWVALRAGTIVAAEMLGKDDELGSVEAGKFADIVAMPGNPADDITATERVSFVMKNGAVVRQ